MTKRWPVILAGCGVLGVGVVAWVHREELTAWYRFVERFERLGLNEQGYVEYRHRPTGIVMVYLPRSTFTMGSPETEEGAWENERPQHRVPLDPFLIARFEVSQAIWRRVMGSDPSRFRGDTLPVEQVSWDDCRVFCRKTGLALPSEAQWEYACRGGTTTPYAFGEALTSDQANFNANFPYGDSPAGKYRERTVPVDSFEPNGFGLHNTHGNLAEWCEDAYDEDFYRMRDATRKNALCTVGSGNRVVRGGAWLHRARYCRSASRGWDDPSTRSLSVGFRPVFHLD